MGVYETPPQPDESGGINDLPREDGGPVSRSEFQALTRVTIDTARAVRRIEKAVIGDNPMKPDPSSLAMRVDDHEKAIKLAKFLSVTAFVGMVGLIGRQVWALITTGHQLP